MLTTEYKLGCTISPKSSGLGNITAESDNTRRQKAPLRYQVDGLFSRSRALAAIDPQMPDSARTGNETQLFAARSPLPDCA